MSKGKGRGKPPRYSRLGHGEISAIFEKLEESDERTAAIVAGSVLENALAIVIQSRLRALDPSEQKELFDRDFSVLNTFNDKIQIAYALGLYSWRVKDDLILIKNIRNAFAHHIFVDSFDHEEVRGDCDALFGPTYLKHEYPDTDIPDRQAAYVSTAFNLMIRFELELMEVKRPDPPKHLTYERMPEPSPKKS